MNGVVKGSVMRWPPLRGVPVWRHRLGNIVWCIMGTGNHSGQAVFQVTRAILRLLPSRMRV